MYSGQLEKLSFFSVAETSVAVHAAFSASVFFAGFVPHAARAPPVAMKAPPANRPRIRVRRDRPVALRTAAASGESGGERGFARGLLRISSRHTWGAVTDDRS